MKKLLLAAVLLPVSAIAGYISLEMENDIFQGDDSDYTHGTRIVVGTDAEYPPDWVVGFMRATRLLDPEKAPLDHAWVVGQNMFTPDDITSPDLIADDRPYAGYLYGGFVLRQRAQDSTTFVELDLGVVGPHSYAGDTQTWVHRHTGNRLPQGWDNQLHDEPTIQLQYWKSKSVFFVGDPDGWGVDANPRLGVLAGNVQSSLAAGNDFRFGYSLPPDQGPGIITPTSFGKRGLDRGYGYIFFGAEGRAVAWNIFLDGNTDGDSHSVDKEPLVADVKIGLAFGVGPVELRWTTVSRSREYKQQDEPQHYSSATISCYF